MQNKEFNKAMLRSSLCCHVLCGAQKAPSHSVRKSRRYKALRMKLPLLIFVLFFSQTLFGANYEGYDSSLWHSADDNRFNNELGVLLKTVQSASPYIQKITFDRETKYGEFTKLELIHKNSDLIIPMMYEVKENKIEVELHFPLISASHYRLDATYVKKETNAKNTFSINLPHAL